MKTKFIVYDSSSDLNSRLYYGRELAQNDLENDISFKWSANAEVLEVEVIE